MLERQRESVAKAKVEGKYKGRPAKQLGVARSTVYRLLGQASPLG
jgi:DNA invertase Pin-like site-specific DNA recombinase